MTTTLAPKRLCGPNDPEWLSLRMRGISASEAGAACGVSDYATPLEIYHRKRGELPPIEPNRAMRKGSFMEPFIASEFELETGIKIVDHAPGLYCHSEFEWIMATPDRVIDEASTGLELKDMDPFIARDRLGVDWTDEIPDEWTMQAQQQMFVMGWQSVVFCVLVNRDLRYFSVGRNETLLARMLSRESELWERIQAGVPPDPIDHETNLRLARDLFKDVKRGEVITLSDLSVGAWERYEELGKEIKHLESERNKAKASVLMELGNAEAGRLPDGRCVRRNLVHVKEYIVPEKQYVSCRAVSGKSYE